MAEWTVRRLLDHTQELVADAPGSFYNISSRLDLFNQAQRELNHETRALATSTDITVVAGTSSYTLPADFLDFDREAPQFVDAAGTYNRIRVVEPAYLDRTIPGWQDATTNVGTPTHLFTRQGQLTLYPVPEAGGTLKLPYLVEPDELTTDDDVPFNGLRSLNRFAPALAYKAAFVLTLARAPQIAGAFQDLYEKQERLMRHFVRSSPQWKPGVWPTQED